jgi:DNA replication protein DnaC
MPDVTSTVAVDTPAMRDRAVRLFRFLGELTGLRIKKTRDLSAYESVFWFKDLPQEREVYSHAQGTSNEEEPWLRIDKPKKPLVPKPPVICDGWYDVTTVDDFGTVPNLLDEQWCTPVFKNGEVVYDGEARQLLDVPEIQDAWDSFILREWRPWAFAMERWERVQQCYRQLFAMHQEQERRGEQYELLVGIGTLLWLDPSKRRVCRPILTSRAVLSLNAQSGRLELNPPEDGVEIKLEQDMLQPNEQPTKECQALVEAKVRDLGSLWDRQYVFPILEEWFGSLPIATDASFTQSLDFQSRAGDTPQLAFAPVLLLRKRQGHSILSALKQVENSLRSDTAVPRGVVEICSTDRETLPANGTPPGELPVDPLFPLPTNEEQRAIVSKLSNRSSVLVQGPPGTGKSHTIVNLVCHFLAQGKRVLVTSQTPRALRVLQDKFPKVVQPLVVSVLDEKEDSRRNLERSVNGILHAVDDSSLEPSLLETRIAAAKNQRVLIRAELSELRRRQREHREADTRQYEIGRTTYKGTPQQIATALAADDAKFDWLDDEIAETTELTISSSEVSEFCRLLDELGTEAEQLTSTQFVDPDQLPTPQEFAETFVEWQAAEKTVEGVDALHKHIAWLAAEKPAIVIQMKSLCADWLRINAATAGKTDWTVAALSDIRTGKSSTWRSLSTQTSTVLDAVRNHFDTDGDSSIEHAGDVSDHQLLADANDLLKHLEAGGGFGFWIFRAGVVKRTQYICSKVRLDGRLCADSNSLRQLTKCLRTRVSLAKLQKEWPAGSVPAIGTLRHRLSSVEQNLQNLSDLLLLDDCAQKMKQLFAGCANGLPQLASAENVKVLAQHCENAIAIQKERETHQRFAALIRLIDTATNLPSPHYAVTTIRNAAFAHKPDQYQNALQDLCAIYQQYLSARQCKGLQERLELIAPRLASRLQSAPERKLLADKLPEFSEAFAWKQAAAWLIRYDAEHTGDALRQSVKHAEATLLSLTSQLVADKAWLACLQHLGGSSDRQGAMTAWQKTVEKIGKGTGKHVESHRRNARKHLQLCWDAIPAHIMPLYRVAEQFKFDQPEMFDIVIVDEASQTGPEGLLLAYLAKQCIVVGDDKQISPEEGFVDVAAVMDLIARLIPDIPFADTLVPGTSLFDQIQIRHQTRLTLREHFRCMPEIIRFSNDLSYQNTPLIPLRQYPADRLTPLVSRFVADGYREGTSDRVINRPEAAAVAKGIIECLEDSRYRGKSLGVICLQGHAQARLIETMILERIGPDPFKDPKTQLLCGDSYSFQGDERDVIFLSMVAASEGDTKNAPLTKKQYLQRFNVAASRARDQMWLFHSVRESDLNPNCVRRRLVQFMSSNPELQSPNVELTTVRHEAAHTKRERSSGNFRGNQPAPFDSWFEVDVFLALIDRGYRVLPQYPVAQKRIDLVVEDSQRRIAIECDGDEWHGPDEYEADCLREGIISRCGWQFARVRASSFYAQRVKAIEKLIDKITLHGVRPWNPSVTDEAYSALDSREVSGAESLVWLGEEIVDTAEAGLSEISITIDAGSIENVETLPRVLTVRHDEANDMNGSFSGEETDAPESSVKTDVWNTTPRDGATTADIEKLIDNVVSFLSRMGEARTAGSIKYQTGIRETDWPEIEKQLLLRKLVKTIGSARRPKFELISR